MLSNTPTVVLTGVGRGLGRALTRAFIEDGALVVGIARTQNSIDELKEEFLDAKFDGYVADVSDSSQMFEIFSDVAEKCGRIDVLFNNAAVYPKVNFLEESAEDWQSTISINLGGVANCCKAVLPHMIKAGKGRIYNVGSWADQGSVPHSAAYAASKGGIHGLTRAIAADIEHLNLDIEIHEWMPGHLKTRMSDFTGIDPATSAIWGVQMVTRKSDKKSTVFVRDHEWHPSKGLRAKLKEAVFFWR